jgi:hypothetical protein
MTIISEPIATTAIVNPDGTMSDQFRAWVQAITRLNPVTGSGSPEGVVSAGVNKLYIDLDGTAGSILYVKRDSDVSLDPKDGWVLV